MAVMTQQGHIRTPRAFSEQVAPDLKKQVGTALAASDNGAS